MTWWEEAEKLDPVESAKKYVEWYKKGIDVDECTEGELVELDMLWYSALGTPESEAILDTIR